MNGVWHFFDPSTGLFVGRKFRGPAGAIEANTPDGLVAWPGDDVDPACQRLDLETGQLVAWQPESPGPDHEWDGRRWVKSSAAVAEEAGRSIALGKILVLERKQARALREAALGQEGATERLAAIDAEIAALRADL